MKEFQTEQALREAIDNPTPEFQDLLDEMFRTSYEIGDVDELDENGLPYWLVDMPAMWENEIEIRRDGDRVGTLDVTGMLDSVDNSEFALVHVNGYHNPYWPGDIVSLDGREFVYLDSQKLDEEVEHQAEDGGLVYEYRGSSFLRILIELELVDCFIKERSPEPGESVSHATLLPEDLYRRFLSAVEEFGAGRHITGIRFQSTADIDHFIGRNSEEAFDHYAKSEAGAYDIEELFDALDAVAPEDHYFGAHIGNASEFGYWLHDDE